jgi:hypothetical protein
MSPKRRRGKRCRHRKWNIASQRRRSPESPGGHLAGAPRPNQSPHAGRTTKQGSKQHVERLQEIARKCAQATGIAIRAWSLLPEDLREAIIRAMFG